MPTWINPDAEEGGGEQYRTILEVWASVLKPAEEEQARKVMPQWANRIVSSYPGVAFQDMTRFRDLYFSRVLDLSDILKEHIDTDDECLKRISAEEDAQLNGLMYKLVITDWQKQFVLWELEWDTEGPAAAIELAAMAEVHKMFFSQEGLITLLDQIDLQFTEDDRDALAAELQGMRDVAEER